MTRNDILSQAVNDCLKELYSWATPKIDWKNFIEENKLYSKKYKEWELITKDKILEKPSCLEYCGPRPYEFYYLPREIHTDIVNSFIYAYKLDSQQELLNTIEILKNYCKEPIVDKYIEGENGFPGHRGYDHPDNLYKELVAILKMYCNDSEADFGYIAQEVQNKLFEFLDMAGNFYNWNRELNSFNMSVSLGPSPNSNKQAVIDNWKKYRNQDIEINEEQIKKDYYGEELD